MRLSRLLRVLTWATLFGSGLAACASSTGGRGPRGAGASTQPLPRDVVARSALPLTGRSSEEQLDEAALFARLAQASVVCFGERHENAAHHFAELRALRELSRRAAESGDQLAVGFEMFQRPYQSALTSYVKGAIDEPALLEQSEYETRWGYDFSLYRPLLEEARSARLDALALNAPKELSRKLARGGLTALDEAERAALPEMVLDDPSHRAHFDRAMEKHPMPAGGPKLDDMYAAQVLWDETMAETAANWLWPRGEQARMILFAGSGHCHRNAIPARLSRRTGRPVLAATAVLASELDELRARSEYDLLVVLED